jgi:riboflavin synthase
MFTGLITEVGRVVATTPLANGAELTIEAPATAARAATGASIAVDGVCLTATHVTPTGFRVQAVGVTLERTTLGRLSTGSRVNLEPSLRVGDELGGHLVTGHVDATGTVHATEAKGDAWLLTIGLPGDIARFVAVRGSLAVAGVSLTVAAIDGTRATFSIIPHTKSATTLGDLRPGDPVNLEVDLVARYLERFLAVEGRAAGSAPAPPSAVTLELLKEKFS